MKNIRKHSKSGLSILVTMLILIVSVMSVSAATTLPDNMGPKVAPVLYIGNPPPLESATGYTYKTPMAPVHGVTYSLNIPIDGVTYVFKYEVYGEWGNPDSAGSKFVRFWTEGDFPIVATVVVKGGPDAYIYNYSPQTNNDSNLRSPTMSNGTIPGISHLDFRFEKPPFGSLRVTKDIVLGNVVNPDAVVIPTFKIRISGPSYPAGSDWVDFNSDGQYHTWMNLIPGDYTVEEMEAGVLWNESVPAAPHAVTAGNRTDVTVTNTYVPGSLRVTKDIDLGGMDPALITIPTFKIRIWGPSYPAGSDWVDFNSDGQFYTWMNLIPGDYTVEEMEAGVLWNEFVPAGPHAVTAGNRTDVTVTNTYVMPQSETAWAFGDHTFIDEGISAQWGWFSHLAQNSESSFTLWAGAGQNDTSKGTDVGTVYVRYQNDGKVIVRIVLRDNVMALNAAQVYAGYDMPGASPGRYPFRVSADGLEQTLMIKKSAALFEGQIYFALHLDVIIFK